MNPLIKALRDPGRLSNFSLTEWDELLRLARKHKLLAHIGERIRQLGIEASCPPEAIRIWNGARADVNGHQLQARRELRQLNKALANMDVPIILLKGCAYEATGLSLSRGRSLSDVDLMVPANLLESVEQQLLTKGWLSEVDNKYDQHYYREWSHEIPPLKHPERGIEVDLHHHILPPTTRLHPDVELLWQSAQQIPHSPFQALSHIDMLLHSITHLFYDGDLTDGLRDLVDIQQMLSTFSSDSNFWENLLSRARQLELGRPLYYALHLNVQLLQTPVPPEILVDINKNAPNPIIASLTQFLMRQVLTPREPIQRRPAIFEWLLFVRSHWIRMPPLLLMSHLSRKSWRRVKGETY